MCVKLWHDTFKIALHMELVEHSVLQSYLKEHFFQVYYQVYVPLFCFGLVNFSTCTNHCKWQLNITILPGNVHDSTEVKTNRQPGTSFVTVWAVKLSNCYVVSSNCMMSSVIRCIQISEVIKYEKLGEKLI